MRDFNPSQGFNPPHQYYDNDWAAEEKYWQDNWRTRPYAAADLGFDYYQPAYRYGYEARRLYPGRTWDAVESDLKAGWDTYQYRRESAWDKVKDAVLDAWNRFTS